MKISIISPCYNEEENIELFYEKTKELMKDIDYELIFVNDGSEDNTLNKLKDIYKNNSNIKIISFSRNFGKDAAIYAGLKHAKGDFSVIIDSDLQHHPKYIISMYNFLIENEDYDAVCMCHSEKKKRFLHKTFYKIFSKLSDTKYINGASDFRMFRKNMVSSILEMNEKNRFSKGIFNWVGFKTHYEEYIPKERKKGESSYKTKDLFNYAIGGIVGFSTKPLRIATYTGFLSSFSAFVYFFYILIKTLILGKDVPGYASIVCIMLFIGGLQLLCMGILGEYLARTYLETKNRPIFIAREKIGFDETIL